MCLLIRLCIAGFLLKLRKWFSVKIFDSSIWEQHSRPNFSPLSRSLQLLMGISSNKSSKQRCQVWTSILFYIVTNRLSIGPNAPTELLLFSWVKCFLFEKSYHWHVHITNFLKIISKLFWFKLYEFIQCWIFIEACNLLEFLENFILSKSPLCTNLLLAEDLFSLSNSRILAKITLFFVIC